MLRSSPTIYIRRRALPTLSPHLLLRRAFSSSSAVRASQHERNFYEAYLERQARVRFGLTPARSAQDLKRLHVWIWSDFLHPIGRRRFLRHALISVLLSFWISPKLIKWAGLDQDEKRVR